MWAIKNKTPFAAERSWVREKNGAEIWLVAVKATYRILPNGALELAEKQEDVLLAPTYLGEPGQSSLRYESDLVRTKVGTDILLHGHAYASRAQRSIDVHLKVGKLEKHLRVFGDRVWKKGLLWGVKISRPKPFERMPITYERAFGGADQKHPKPKRRGWEPRNPIGTGFAMRAKHLVGQAVPNVEHPKRLISSWKHKPQPAGFGPIPGGWAPRVALAGTYDEEWELERQPLLPEDFDDHFFHCAPEDQRTSQHLKGGEPVELRNLTPGGHLKFELPKVALRFTTHFQTGDPVEHRGVLHTVILEPDVPRVILVWHTALPCHTRVNQLKETVIREKRIVAGFSASRHSEPTEANQAPGKGWA